MTDSATPPTTSPPPPSHSPPTVQRQPSTYSKDASDFMLMEYQQIAAAFFNMIQEINQMFRFYIALITAPLAIIGAIVGITKQTSLVVLTGLSDLLTLLFIAVALSGLLIAVIIINIRLEALLYARVVNGVRGFFKDIDQLNKLQGHLVLPYETNVPPFFEFGESTFFEVILMGFLNGLMMYIGLLNLHQLFPSVSATYATLLAPWIGLALGALHIGAYWFVAHSRTEAWEETAQHT